MNLHEYKRVYCIGIGGIGVSAVARLFVSYGTNVSGSDITNSEIIMQLVDEGVEVSCNQSDGNNITTDIDVIVYSPAIPDINPELQRARELRIPCMSYPEILGIISRERKTIAISGMHGKSTTTAMIGLIFEKAGLDPLVIVGTHVPQFTKNNIRLSQTDDTPFIVEACEYRGHMNLLSPHTIVITNIDEEHLDFYRDIKHIEETFAEFTAKLPDDGLLVRITRDAIVHPLVTSAREVQVDSGLLDIHSVVLTKLGEHIREDAALACAVALEWGIDINIIRSALADFKGIWRRFEIVGAFDDKTILSDYGHHPTEIKATLQATRETYKDAKILLVFQPHQYDRTEKLFDGFVDALSMWDGVIVSDIYDVVGRESSHLVEAEHLVDALKEKKIAAYYGGNIDATEHIARQIISEFDVCVVMGAGTIDAVARCMATRKNPTLQYD